MPLNYPSYYFSKQRLYLLSGVIIFSFSACSSMPGWITNPFGDDDDATMPAELLDIESEVNIDREWTVNIGNGQGDTYTKITPILDEGFVFAASENGEVVAINSINGDIVWQTELDTTITNLMLLVMQNMLQALLLDKIHL